MYLVQSITPDFIFTFQFQKVHSIELSREILPFLRCRAALKIKTTSKFVWKPKTKNCASKITKNTKFGA